MYIILKYNIYIYIYIHTYIYIYTHTHKTNLIEYPEQKKHDAARGQAADCLLDKHVKS